MFFCNLITKNIQDMYKANSKHSFIKIKHIYGYPNTKLNNFELKNLFFKRKLP